MAISMSSNKKKVKKFLFSVARLLPIPLLWSSNAATNSIPSR